MHRLRAHFFDWLFRHVVSPLFRKRGPITVIPSWLQRLGLQLARVLRLWKHPVPAELPRLALVWRHDDVCEVLGDHERFSVKGFDERMTACSNPFLLGMGFTEEYKRQIALLRSVLRPEDRDRVRAIAERHSRNGIAGARASGRIDVVQQLVGPVVAGFLNDYFGVGELSGAVPGRTSPLLQRFLDTASYIFNLELLTGHTKTQAVAAGREIKTHVEAIIAAKRRAIREAGTTGGPAADAPERTRADATVLDRLLALEGVPDELARTLIGGTVSGSIAVTFSQCLTVIDRLMDLPPVQLAEVQHVARSGDEALLGRYVREASRFKPFPPGLLRNCDHLQVIAEHTPRARALPAGTVVVALTWSAAFDREAVPDALTFHSGRTDHEYLLFGTGQHHCVGAQTERPIAQTLMGQMVKALFALPGLRRAPGAAGFIQSDASGGRWPEHFMLDFDAARVEGATPAEAA